MRFFTPALYLAGNSPDEEEVNRAEADWEVALRDYRVHLDSFAGSMPPRVRDVAENLCLHDAEVYGLKADPPGSVPDPVVPVASVSLKQDDQFVNIDYLLWGAVLQVPPAVPWPLSTEPVYWLYDEVDREAARPGHYWHRIFLSDGRTIAVPFIDVILNRISSEKPEPALASRSAG